jgi:hypothetical protein
MAITPAINPIWLKELMDGSQLAADTYKCALYTQAAASLDYTTAVYTSTGEVSGTGYAAGGAAVTLTLSVSGKKVLIDLSDVSWANSSITADGLMVYNTTRTNKTSFVNTFTSKTSTAGTFTVQWPTADATNAAVRLATP